MKNIENEERFIALLETEYTWPDYYNFKFITLLENKDLVLKELEGHEVTFKYSDKSKYVSISTRVLIKNTEEILEIYRRVGAIPGVMSL